MPCSVCKDAISLGNDAVHESLDNFQRFYYNDVFKDSDQIEKHVYQYNSIADNFTRVLELKSGSADEPIICSLSELCIDGPEKYEALSYTWGSPRRSKTIKVDSTDFLVTDNLWTALWHLRLADKSRRIWVDAVCINQEDIEERNRVVGRMKDIYEGADEILAWLGPDDRGGSAALMDITTIHDHYNKLIDKYGTQQAAFQHMVECDRCGLQNPDSVWRWGSIGTLMTSRTWFHRVWIVQEGTTPVRTTFHLCHYQVSVDAVYDVFRLFQHMLLNPLSGKSTKQSWRIEHMLELTNFARKRARLQKSIAGRNRGKAPVRKNDFPLLETLSSLRNHSASDPHDKVYAALGFATDMSEDVPIVIDYRKSFAEMLRDVAVSCLDQKDHNLRFLGYAGMWGSGHMPATWIPDWLIDVPLIEFPKEFDHATTDGTKQLYNASAPEHPLWQEKLYCGLEPKANGNTLVVPGIIVDYIRTISVAPGEESTLSTLEISWMLPNMDEQYLATNEILETAYLRTLVADLADSDGEISGRGGSMYWRHKDVKPANHVNVQQLMYRTCKYRKFLTTQKHRYIGLGPMWAKQGDAIFMLKGGEMLYIARPTLEGTYHFVGEAYVHGMMDGAVVDRYARGEGTMQMVEFAPVRTKVMDSSNVSNDPTKSRVSQSVTEIAPNVQRLEFTNPYERLGMFFHTDVGPRAEDLIAYLTRQTMVECSRHGINTPEAFIKVLLLTGLADASEENAVKQYDVGANVSGSSSGIAGREFAIRDHIRAAFRQARDETETMLQGQVQSSMNTGEVLLATRAKKEKSPETNQEQVTSDDEKLARQLQEEEYLATDPASHASSSHPTPTPQRQTSPREADGPPVPVPSRRRGPPVRLVQSNTHNPRTHSYQFQSKADFNEFAEELRQLASLGKTPPVLWGKWATDPKKRPKVEITTSGHPGELWWEDEFGNVVPGPVETDDDNGDENASGEEQLEKGVTEGKEDINENMEKSKMVYKDPQEWIKDSESKGVEIFGMPVEPLPVLVTTGGWEGIGEAPTPATFDLV